MFHRVALFEQLEEQSAPAAVVRPTKLETVTCYNCCCQVRPIGYVWSYYSAYLNNSVNIYCRHISIHWHFNYGLWNGVNGTNMFHIMCRHRWLMTQVLCATAQNAAKTFVGRCMYFYASQRYTYVFIFLRLCMKRCMYAYLALCLCRC